MDKLSDKEKSVLAQWLGAKHWWSHESSGQLSEPGWLFEQLKPGWPVIMKDQWSPAEKPEQGNIVLRKLVEKLSWDRVLILLVKGNMQCDEFNHNFDFWLAVCREVLALPEVKKMLKELEAKGD